MSAVSLREADMVISSVPTRNGAAPGGAFGALWPRQGLPNVTLGNNRVKSGKILIGEPPPPGAPGRRNPV